MKKIILVLIFAASVIHAQPGWNVQSPFTAKNLYCMSPTAVHNLYSGSDSGIVFKSTDNGYNWFVFVQDTSVKRLPIRSIFGGNNDDFNAAGDSTAYISKVSNQVMSMRIVTGNNQTKPNLKAYSLLQGCCQYEPNVVAGDSGIFYISDLYPWRRDTAATRIAGGTRINSSSSIIFVGDNGLIMKADSIGPIHSNTERMIWRIIPSGTTQNLYGVAVSSSGLCLIVGAGGTILKSSNSGESWIPVPSPVLTDLYAINFSYASLICGANGTILKCTVNTLDNWFRQTTPTSQDLHAILGLTYTDYISAGNNGIILRTTDGGGPPVWVTPISNEIPDRYTLKQNYPNPFNPVTNIQFSIPKAGYIKIVIYDINGKEVETLINEHLSAGIYKTDFDGKDLSSGVYFYKMEANGYRGIKKMIMIK